MAKIITRSPDEAEIGAGEDVAAGVESRSYFVGRYDPLHLRSHRLRHDARLTIASVADSAVFVWRGVVELGGHELTAGSSAVVECGATAMIASLSDNTELLVFSANALNAVVPSSAGGQVRVLPLAAVPRYGDTLGKARIGGAMHADSTCPTCSIWLHENFLPPPRGEPPLVHSHSVDEIIVVTEGELRFGNRHLGPGTALAIAANAFYSFTPGPAGLGFVNFRATRPGEIRFKQGGGVDEAEYWREQTGSPQAITVAVRPVPSGQHRRF